MIWSGPGPVGAADHKYPVPERAQGRNEITPVLARIDSLLASGQDGPALQAARDLANANPDHPRYGGQIASRLGVALQRNGLADEALPYLEQAVQLDLGNPEHHRNLGFTLLEMGRRGRALSEYAQAVELDPDGFTYRLEYGQILLDFGDLERAGPHLEKARQLCGNCPEVQEPLAAFYLQSGSFLRAAAILEGLYDSGPQTRIRRALIQAWKAAGQDSLLLGFLEKEGLKNLATDEIDLLLELEGKFQRSEWSASFAAFLAGQAGGIVPPEEKLDSAGFWGRISYNLLLVHQDQLALAAADKAIELDPKNVVYRNNRVVLLTRLERHEEAAAEWKIVQTLDPSLKERTNQ